MGHRPAADRCFCPERYNPDIDRTIMKTFGEELKKELISNESGVIMPPPFGLVYIAGIPMTVKDHGNSNKHNIDIKHANDHTDGLVYILVGQFFNNGLRVVRRKTKMLKYYKLRPNKNFRKLIKDNIRANNFSHWKTFKSIKEFLNKRTNK